MKKMMTNMKTLVALLIAGAAVTSCSSDTTMDSLKADNKRNIDGFQHVGEQVVLIDSDYEQTIQVLLD